MHTHTCPCPSLCSCFGPCIQHRLVSNGGMPLPKLCRLTDQKKMRGTPACWHCCCQGMHSRSLETLESHSYEHSMRNTVRTPCGRCLCLCAPCRGCRSCGVPAPCCGCAPCPRRALCSGCGSCLCASPPPCPCGTHALSVVLGAGVTVRPIV